MSKHHRVSRRDSQREIRSRSLRFENLEDRRLLAVVTVDTNQDVVDFNDGVTSLREAIFATNLVGGADEIQFDFGHDGPETIVLTLGELAITDSLTITGPGADLLTIDASGNDPTPDENNGDGSRVFNIDDGNFETLIEVEIRGLTLTGADELSFGGAIHSFESLFVADSTISGNSTRRDGGGIDSFIGSVTITGSTISDNSAGEDGGGVSVVRGAISTITDSTISGNSAGDDGGGISVAAVAISTITNSTISGNSAGGDGGGIRSSGVAIIIGSTITGNSAHSEGGGIIAFGTMTITDSTISDNMTNRKGGGISALGETTITDSTISGNSVGSRGGGIFVRGTTTITNSTISGNSSGAGAGGIWADDGTTMITDSTISGNFAGNNAGGIWAADGTTTITESTISGNSSGATAGGIRSTGVTIITGSTVSGNFAGSKGGGIYASNTTTITDSTILGNSAGGDGGGIWAFSRFTEATTITNSTISGNSANNNGGGIYVDDGTGAGIGTISHSTITGNVSDADQSGVGSGGGLFVRNGTLRVNHTIVARNRDLSNVGPDVTGFIGAVIDPSFSLIGNNQGSGLVQAPVGAPDANGNLIGGSNFSTRIDPLLGPLADNGGPTQTHALLPGSPAIDAGVPGAVANANGIPEFDQRGFPFVRVSGGRIDIGAIEMQPLPGDFNGDGSSDGSDFLAWQRGFLKPSVATAEASTATSDVGYDSNDLKAWEATYGTQTVLPPALSLVVASDSPTDTRLNPRLVDAALAVGLDETDRFSPGRRVAGPRETVVIDEVFQSTDFFGPPASPANPPGASFSRHLFDSRHGADMSQEMSDELLKSQLAAESFALL